MKTMTEAHKEKLRLARESRDSRSLRCPFCRTTGDPNPMRAHILACFQENGKHLPSHPPEPDIFYSLAGYSREEERDYRASLDEKARRRYFLLLFEESGKYPWRDTIQRVADIVIPE